MKKLYLFMLGCAISLQAAEQGNVSQATQELADAVSQNDFEAAKKAVELGADINGIVDYVHKEYSRDVTARGTPLMIAVRLNNKPMADYLLMLKGININKISRHGFSSENVPFEATPLIFAVAHNELPLIELLLKHGADTESSATDGSTPLFYARTKDAVNLLLGRGANPNSRDKHGNTPAISAVVKGYLDVLPILLERGSDTTIVNDAGKTVFTQKIRKSYSLRGNQKALDEKKLQDILSDYKKQIHKTARRPQIEPVTQEQLGQLSEAERKQAFIMPSQPALRGLIASYVEELSPEERRAMEQELQSEPQIMEESEPKKKAEMDVTADKPPKKECAGVSREKRKGESESDEGPENKKQKL